MLVIHTAAKTPKGKGCSESLPVSLHVCAAGEMLSGFFVFVLGFFSVKFLLNFKNSEWMCVQTHMTETHLSLRLSEILTSPSVPVECGEWSPHL